MNEILVVLSSLTSANRLKKYLSKMGVTVYIIQTPKAMQLSGCGYSLRANYNDIDMIFDAIDDLKVSTRGAFWASDYKKIR